MATNQKQEAGVSRKVVLGIGIAVASVAAVLFGFTLLNPWQSVGFNAAASTPVTADFTYQVDGTTLYVNGNISEAGEGHEVVSYKWNFSDGDPVEGVNPSHTYAADGTYHVVLTATDDAGKSADISKEVVIAAGSVADGPDSPGLEDAGPGGCIPGNEFLAKYRTEKPGGEDYQPPYSASELLTLQNAEIVWVREHLGEPCVKALAGSFNVTPAQLPGYMAEKLHLQETAGLRTQNSYFAADGHIVWWKIQTFPAGELIWMDAAGVEQMKYVCGNRLRPAPPLPTPTETPTPTQESTPPAEQTTPPGGGGSCESGCGECVHDCGGGGCTENCNPPCEETGTCQPPPCEETGTCQPPPCTPVALPDDRYAYDDSSHCSYHKKAQTFDQQQNQGPQVQPPQDNHTSGVYTGPTKDGNGNVVPEPSKAPVGPAPQSGVAPPSNNGTGYDSGGSTGSSPGGSHSDSNGTTGGAATTPAGPPADSDQGGSGNNTDPGGF